MEAVDHAHRTVGLRGDIIVVLILATFMVNACAEVFWSVLVLDALVVSQEFSDGLVARDVFFFDLVLALVKDCPTVLTEVLLVIQTVPLHLLALTHAAELD